MTRAFSTLTGAALAGGLLWVAAQMHRDTTGGYWALMGILAGAGLALAIARLPDVGLRTIVPSFPTFAFAFVPALIAASWVIVAMQPHGNWFRRHVLSWSSDIGVTRVVRDLDPFTIVLAFGIGIVFGLVFQRRVVETVEEPLTEPVAARPVAPVRSVEPETVETTAADRELVTH